MAWVLDPMDKEKETYFDFLTILQRSGTGHCRYYVYKYMKVDGHYKRFPASPPCVYLLYFTAPHMTRTVFVYVTTIHSTKCCCAVAENNLDSSSKGA